MYVFTFDDRKVFLNIKICENYVKLISMAFILKRIVHITMTVVM